jgi:hypothetical protein
MAARWKRDSTHGNECRKCNEAAQHAKSQAIVAGSVACTWTEGEHEATMSRRTDNN